MPVTYKNYYVKGSTGGSGGSGGGGGTGSGGLSSKVRTAQKNLAEAYILQKQVENNGTLLPSFYNEAANTYFKDYLDDPDMAGDYWSYLSKGQELNDKQKSSAAVLQKEKQDFQDTIQQVVDNDYNKPDTFISKMSYLYNAYLDTLQFEMLPNRQADNTSANDVIKEINEITQTAEKLNNLTLLRSAEGQKALGLSPEEAQKQTQNMAFVFNTDQATGDIVDVKIQDQSTIKSDFGKTNKTFGGLPVFGNVIKGNVNEDTKIKIGNEEFSRKPMGTNTAGTIQYEDIYKPKKEGQNWLGQKNVVFDDKEGALDAQKMKKSNLDNFAPGTILKDTKGDLYYNGQNGWYKAKDKDILGKFLNTKPESFDSSPMVGLNKIYNLPDLLDDKGNIRTIDENMLGQQNLRASTNNIPIEQLQPSMAPTPPAQMSASFSQAPETPRKSFTVKEPTGLNKMLSLAKGIFSGGK